MGLSEILVLIRHQIGEDLFEARRVTIHPHGLRLQFDRVKPRSMGATQGIQHPRCRVGEIDRIAVQHDLARQRRRNERLRAARLGGRTLDSSRSRRVKQGAAKWSKVGDLTGHL
jgi:hypothetical protein